jgi:hypothetical protein
VLDHRIHETPLLTGAAVAATGVEVADELDVVDPGAAGLTTRLITTVLMTRRGVTLAAVAEALDWSAGSAPFVICQERPAPSRVLTTAASATTLPVRRRVEGRRLG